MEKADGRTVAFHTLGCRVNAYDTEAVATVFRQRGYRVVEFDDIADVYVINTCSVTNTGAAKSRKYIRRAINSNPRAIVVAMGCYAQYAPGEVAGIPGVDIVVGSHRRSEIVNLVEQVERDHRPINVVGKSFGSREFEELPVDEFETRTRAMVKIQDGCNEFCAFCQIPWARGRNRSRQPQKVLEQVKRLVASGHKEVVLTGVHIGTYGFDLDPAWDLADIIVKINDIPGLERIRISSIDPHEVDDKLIAVVRDYPKVCRHLHVAAQSGDDRILLAMRRRNSVDEFRIMAEKVWTGIPDVAFTTDIIVGFPGETDAQFHNTMDFCGEIGFSKVHVFPYSRRSGTTADKMAGHVRAKVKEERTARLLQLSDRLAERYNRRFVGREVEVLVERESEDEKGIMEGLTDTYIRTQISSDRDLRGAMVRAIVEEATSLGIQGRFASKDLAVSA